MRTALCSAIQNTSMSQRRPISSAVCRLSVVYSMKVCGSGYSVVDGRMSCSSTKRTGASTRAMKVREAAPIVGRGTRTNDARAHD